MDKILRRGLSAPGSVGSLVLVAVIIAVIILFLPKTLNAGNNIFDFFDIGKNSPDKEELSAEILSLTGAYEFCKSIEGNDCLCDSGENLDIRSRDELKINKKGSDIEISYKGQKQTIHDVEFCVMTAVVEKYVTFSRAITGSGEGKILYRSENGKVVYEERSIELSYETSPIKLFKHTEDGKTYLCLSKYLLGHKTC